MIDPLIIEVDETRAVAATQRANRAIDDYGTSGVRSGKAVSDSFNEQAVSARSAGGAFESVFRNMGNAAQSTVARIESGFSKVAASIILTAQSVSKGIASAYTSVSQFMERSVEQAKSTFARIANFATETARKAVAIPAAFATAVGVAVGHAKDGAAKIAHYMGLAADSASAAIARVIEIGGTVYATLSAAQKLEIVMNRVRGAEIVGAGIVGGFGGALAVATEISAIVALEKIAAATIRQSHKNEDQAVFGNKSELSIDTVQEVGMAAKLSSADVGMLSDALKKLGDGKNVADLGAEFKRLGEIQDPVERIRQTFNEFGAEIGGKVLPFLDDRLDTNAQRIRSWGITIGDEARSHMNEFARDLHSFQVGFQTDADAIEIFAEKLGLGLKEVFADAYVGFKRLKSAMDQARQDVLHGSGARSGAEVINSILFPGAIENIAEIAKNKSAVSGLQTRLDAAGESGLRPGWAGPAQASLEQRAAEIAKVGARDREITRLEERVATERKFLFPESEAEKSKSRIALELQPGIRETQERALGGDFGRLTSLKAEKKAESDAEEAKRKAKAEAESIARQAAALSERQRENLPNILASFAAKPLGPYAEIALRAEKDITSGKYIGEAAQKIREAAQKEERELFKRVTDTFRQTHDMRPENVQMEERIAYALAEGTQIMAQPFRPTRKQSIDPLAELQRQYPKDFGNAAINQIGLNIPGPSSTQQNEVLQERLKLEERRIALQNEPGKEFESARKTLAVRQQIAELEAQVLRDQTKEETDDVKRAIELYNVEFDLNRKLFLERSEYENQIFALRKQQSDSIKRETEGLLHTLFTSPADFGKQFLNTIKEAALKPVIEGFSNIITKRVTPMVFGQDGQGGVNGAIRSLFGQQRDSGIPIISSAAGPAVPVVIVNASGGTLGSGGQQQPFSFRDFLSNPGAAGRRAMESVTSSVSFPTAAGGVMAAGGLLAGLSGGGSSIPAGSTSTAIDFGGGSIPLGGSVQGGGFNLSSLLGAPGGTSGFAGPVEGYGGGGASGGGFGGFKGLLGSLKGSLKGLGGFIGYKGNGQWATGTDSTGAITEGQGLGGAAKGIGHSDAFAAAGLALAMNGLVGKRAGTWGGIAEGTAGGAMVGYKFGGPIGALIGAAAGFGVGMGEKLAGVESKERQAIRLIKQTYGVTIDMKMAAQIADLARSKYSGHVSIAVMDPEVRKMLELYSAGTGQRMPASQTSPRAGSLVQQGGSLMQEQQYRYGQGYTLASNLGTAGASPTSVSISIAGQGAGQFLAGNVVSPEFVQARFSQSQQNSNGRMQNSALFSTPGLVVA